MQPADFTRFRNVMFGMGKLYERELDQVVLDTYWLALRDWSLEEFEACAVQLMRSARFMPRPADFNDLRKAALPTKGEAWARVLQHCKSGYRDGKGLTPEIDRAVHALGGYRYLAMAPIDQLQWHEKRFAEHYEDMAEAEEKRDPFRLPASVRNLLSAP
jgi:hypothetical protein